jgi:CHAT domain-containing protein/predicted negative regulator of RcsB-dependent stress response
MIERFLSHVFLIGLVSFGPSAAMSQEQDEQRTRQEVLSIFRETGEAGLRSYASVHKDSISSALILSFAQNGLDRRDTSLLSAALVLAKEKDENKILADVYFRYGVYYSYTSSNSKAVECYNIALSFYIELRDEIGQGNVYERLGTVYLTTGDNQNAVAMYQKALPYYERGNAPLGQANVYKGLGNAYLRTGDNQNAVVMYQKALPYYERGDTPLGQANVYKSLGDAYLYTGDNQEAVAMYQKALPSFQRADDALGQGNVYQHLGDVYLRTGDIQNAVVMYQKALPFYERADDALGQGNVYLRLGDVYLRLGDNQNALAMYQKALLVYHRGSDDLGWANVCKRVGDVYLSRGDNQNAVVMYQKALPYFDRAGDPIGQGNVYQCLGDVYLSRGEDQEALAMYEKAFPYYEWAGDPIGQGNVYQSLGDVYLSTGDNRNAVVMYEKALLFYERTGDLEMQGYTFIALAGVAAVGKRSREALQHYDAGLSLLEKVRGQTGFTGMKMSFLEKVSRDYETAALFMLENNYTGYAFRIAEGIKARAFSDQLAEKNLSAVDKGLDPELGQRKNAVTAKLSLVQVSLRNAKGEQEYQRLMDEYNKVEGEWETLTQQIRIRNPLYASVKYPQAVTVEELQKILKPEEALLEYFVSDSGAYVFVVTKETFQAVKLPVSAAELENGDTTYCRNLQDETTLTTESNLYEMLIRPVERYIKDKKVLIIVPDGFLAKLPFEPIIEEGVKPTDIGKRPEYLGEEYTIKYIQSATLLSLLRTTLKRESANTGFIGFGDPVYDYEDFVARKPEVGQGESSTKGGIVTELKRDSYTRAGGTLKRLEGSGKEVEEIAQLFASKHQDTACCVRVNAREEQAKEEAMKKYGYILFSCHGLLADEFQSLVLSQIPGAKEDGYLTLDEIMNLDWDARLVVLSACETGRGKIRRGEGVIGLTRAVMYAGTPAAVVSLWSVSDEGTRELMTKFFEKMLRHGLSKEEALRQAKLEMLQGRFSNPYYWSAFVMYGE